MTLLRRWARQWAITVLLALAAVTGFSFVYNAVTQGSVALPPGLRFVQTGDIRTRYVEWGASGTPVVLVHGFIESADTWAPTARLLAADHRVYAIDLDGFGYTQRVAPYTTDHDTAQLLDFISALHLARPVLVGHSSGAAVVADAALRAPARVGGVMFLDGDGLPLPGGRRPPTIPQPFGTTILRLALRSDTAIRLIYATTCGPTCPALDAAGVEQWRRPFQVPGAESAVWQVVGAGIPSLAPGQLAGLARLASVPRAVVFGADDPEYASGAAAQTAALIGAPAPLLIPSARHLTPISSPAAVSGAVERLAARAAANPVTAADAVTDTATSTDTGTVTSTTTSTGTGTTSTASTSTVTGG
ncbi:MAG TPA: alpha/beta hydrolase [Actinocrinis sp.]|nr:alpha/beta hydrolase [Actinocrinis sp.]